MAEGFYENSYRLKEGAILLYTRTGAKKLGYQARLKVPGVTGYVIRALKTRDLNTAVSEAEDLFYALKAEQKLGLDVRLSGNLKFKDFWKRFYHVHETGLSVHRQKLHKFMAAKYFIPYFGEYRVSDLPDAFVEKYWDWRINYHHPDNWEDEEDIPPNAVRIPAQKTLDMEASMLRQIFRWGIIRNETVRRFWRYEFEQYHFRQKADAVAPIQNKLGALLSDPTLYPHPR